MDEDDKTKLFIFLILLVGFFPNLSFILVWFIENVMTPIGQNEDLAWALSSPDPWVLVARLAILLAIGAITLLTGKWIIDKVKEIIGI